MSNKKEYEEYGDREEYLVFGASVENIKNILKRVENKIGFVEFVKRSDGSNRRMTYRLHVKDPKWASKPKGLCYNDVEIDGTEGVTVSNLKKVGKSVVMQKPMSSEERAKWLKRVNTNDANNQITVFDVNVKGEDKAGKGGWRTIPLENVKEIKVNKKTYYIEDIKV
jgi:hypothetical protein